MSVTAHKIRHTFHVNYNLNREIKLITDTLKTESGDIIQTELLDVLETERFEGTAQILRAHKVGHNTFVATNRG